MASVGPVGPPKVKLLLHVKNVFGDVFPLVGLIAGLVDEQLHHWDEKGWLGPAEVVLPAVEAVTFSGKFEENFWMLAYFHLE